MKVGEPSVRGGNESGIPGDSRSKNFSPVDVGSGGKTSQLSVERGWDEARRSEVAALALAGRGAHLLQSPFATNEEFREGRGHASGAWVDLGTEPGSLPPLRQHTQTMRGSCPQITPHVPNVYCDG